MNITNRILWVFSTEATIASDIVGGIMPANYLKIKKIIFLEKDNVTKTLDHYDPKIIIFGKCQFSNIKHFERTCSTNDKHHVFFI